MSEPWVITIALIAVMLICYIVSSCLHKEEKTISYTLIAAGVTLILSGVPTFEELILGIVANLLNVKLVAAEGEYWVRIIAGLALIVLGIALVFKIKKRIYVLNMYGIAAKKNIDDPKSAKDLKLAEYKIKEQVVNFTPFFEGNAMTQKMNNSICEQINEETKRFSAKASEQKESCFTGMAPIPYTVYAGTLLEEAKIYRYFEYNNKSNGGYYYELKKAKNKKGKTYPKLNLTFPEKPDTAAQEVVLAISITHNVRDEDVSQFNTDVVRNPLAINNWFSEAVKEKGDKLRSVVRLSKMFCKSRDSWVMPGGLIQSVLCDECFVDYERLDECFYYTMKNIVDRLDDSIEVYNPTDATKSLLLKQKDRDKMNNWKNRLSDKISKMGIITKSECTKKQAFDSWHSFFNHSFWEYDSESNEKNQYANVNKDCPS